MTAPGPGSAAMTAAQIPASGVPPVLRRSLWPGKKFWVPAGRNNGRRVQKGWEKKRGDRSEKAAIVILQYGVKFVQNRIF